jgi:hypothetical protein
MEILKANTVNVNTYMTHVTDQNWDSLMISDINDIYDEPPKSSFQMMLDRDFPIININDFDTCRNDYSDNNYDTRDGYNQVYNKYLWEFENC